MWLRRAVFPEEIGGVRVVCSKRARRMSLRVDSRKGDVVLTLPLRASLQKAEKFVDDSRTWIERQRIKNASRPVVSDGMELYVLGQRYVLRHVTGRGVSRFDGGSIVIHGDAAHLRRRLCDFLKKQAELSLCELAREKARRLGLPPTSVRVIDPKARWGSCAPDGKLMFSWRLILTPLNVMDYVVAHEVAHRIHMNHSKKFWLLCNSLTEDAHVSRKWLRVNGDNIMRNI